jgi:hypothetical protein
MSGVRCGAPGGPLSRVPPRPHLAQSFPAVAPISSGPAPQSPRLPGLLPSPPASGGSRVRTAPRAALARSPSSLAFRPKKVVAPSSSSPSDHWGGPSFRACGSLRDSQARWGQAAGAGLGRPAGECPTPVRPLPPCAMDSTSEAVSVPSAGTRRAHGSLCLRKGAGCAGAGGPLGTSPLWSPGPPPELVPEVVGNLALSTLSP